MKASGLKACVLFIKYIPILSALVMFLYVSTLLFSKTNQARKTVVESVFTLPAIPTAGTLIISKNLGFCNLHRYFVGYTYGVTACISHQSNVGFGSILVPMRTFMFVTGILLFTSLIIHILKHRIRFLT